MVRTFTIQGYGPSVTTAEARFTGALSDAQRIADELVLTYGARLTAVVVTGADSDEIVYVTYRAPRRA